MNEDEAPSANNPDRGQYDQLPESVAAEDLITTTSTTYPSLENSGEYDRQEAFLRSYGAG